MTGEDARRSGSGAEGAKGHIRGSSLLFAGRLLAILINFAGQVVVVRYLSKGDYGALAWAISIVTIGTALNLAGTGRAVSRLVPTFDEAGDGPAARGTVMLAVSTIVGLGVALVALVIGGRALIEGTLSQDPLSVELLVAMALLLPLQAFDQVFQELCAVLVGARAIFFRRHLLGPLLKLAAALVVVALRADVTTLAVLHVAAGAIGVALYLLVLARTPSVRRLLRGPVRWPLREVRGIALPMLANETISVLGAALAVILLEARRGSAEVASFRAVVPVAGLILVVLQSFRFLFVPLASRLLARGDAAGVAELYQRTALWITLLSFPAFAVCVGASEPLVRALFGERYAGSADLLAILAIGSFFAAIMGIGADTLLAAGRMRLLLGANVVGFAIRAGLLLALVPAFGAPGAAIGTAIAAVCHNGLFRLAVGRVCDLAAPSALRRAARTRVIVATLALVVLTILLRWWGPGQAIAWTLGSVGALCASAVVVGGSREALDLAGTFPELGRVPGVGRWLMR